jgi:DnaK suppressor protein
MKSENLTTAQLETLRHSLEAKRGQLLRDLERRSAETVGDADDSAELEDVAEGVIEDRENAAVQEHRRKLLQEIEHALRKTQDGTYGLSEASGRPIPFQRLRVSPWARYDSDEADRLEKRRA